MNYDLNTLSLGAGVQSTALLLMAQDGRFGEPPDCAIFSDTQWEPDTVYEQLDRIVAISDIPIHIVTAGNLREDVLKVMDRGDGPIGRVANPPFYVKQDTPDKRGPDSGGMLWRGCTAEYKIAPIQRKTRELLGYKPRQRVKKRVRQWFGISIDEAHRQRDSRVGWIDNYYPLIDNGISRIDCTKYLKEKGFGEIRKSACIACPYHSNAMWANMRDKHPDEFQHAVEFDHELRQGKLPGVTGEAFVHRKFLPLEQAVEATHNSNQIDFLDDFGEECEGMCGL